MKGRKMPSPDGPYLTATLTDITAARVDHPASTGIDHLKAAAVIGNATITTLLFFLAVRFTDVGFLVRHGEASLVCIAAPTCRDAWLLGSLRVTQ